MALRVTTIILPSPLETNRSAKPHCCRSVYSSLIAPRHHEATHTRSAFSPPNTMDRHCTKLQQNSAVSWLELAWTNGCAKYKLPLTTLLAPRCCASRDLACWWGSAWLLARRDYPDIYAPPPTHIWEHSASAPSGHWHWAAWITASCWCQSNHLVWFPGHSIQMVNCGNTLLSPVAELYHSE